MLTLFFTLKSQIYKKLQKKKKMYKKHTKKCKIIKQHKNIKNAKKHKKCKYAQNINNKTWSLNTLRALVII